MIFTPEDERFMRLALEKANEALDNDEIPVGCVIARGDTVLYASRNESEAKNDLTAHAEMLAISGLGRRALKDAVMYVTLEPCPMCAGAIALSGLKRVIYGASDKKYGCCGSVYRITEDPAFPGFVQADGGLLSAECEAALQRGFARIRGKKP